MTGDALDAAPDRPALRVVGGGEPTAEELAALTVVLATRAGRSDAGGPPPARSRWADRRRLLRAALEPGPAGWLASARR